MQQQFSNEATLNLEALRAGMYLITLQNEKTLEAVKFVKTDWITFTAPIKLICKSVSKASIFSALNGRRLMLPGQ